MIIMIMKTFSHHTVADSSIRLKVLGDSVKPNKIPTSSNALETPTSATTSSTVTGVVNSIKVIFGSMAPELVSISKSKGSDWLSDSSLTSLTTRTVTDGCFTQKNENSWTKVVLVNTKKNKKKQQYISRSNMAQDEWLTWKWRYPQSYQEGPKQYWQSLSIRHQNEWRHSIKGQRHCNTIFKIKTYKLTEDPALQEIVWPPKGATKCPIGLGSSTDSSNAMVKYPDENQIRWATKKSQYHQVTFEQITRSNRP